MTLTQAISDETVKDQMMAHLKSAISRYSRWEAWEGKEDEQARSHQEQTDSQVVARN